MNLHLILIRNVAKIINVKVFNLMPRTNKTRHIKLHETCSCNCRLNVSNSNFVITNNDGTKTNEQLWNKDKCRVMVKNRLAKGICDKRFIWNLVIVNCDVEEYLD